MYNSINVDFFNIKIYNRVIYRLQYFSLMIGLDYILQFQFPIFQSTVLFYKDNYFSVIYIRNVYIKIAKKQ